MHAEPPPRPTPDDFRMPLGEHIEELRRCLILALIGVGVALIGCFYFGFHIIAWLAQPLIQTMDALGYPPQTYTRDATAGFGTYMKVSLIAALIVSSPWIIIQLWRFVASGLYAHEKKIVYILAPFSFVMMVLGVLFAYYILLPVGLFFFFDWATKYPQLELNHRNFMTDLLVSGQPPRPEIVADPDAVPMQLPVLVEDPAEPIDGMLWIDADTGKLKTVSLGKVHTFATAPDRLLAPLPEIGDYVKLAAGVGLGVVLAFQTPVVMLVLGWTGAVDPRWLGRMRKYALFFCAITGAIFTPADPFSMFVLAVPLYLLYEFGLVLMRIVYREPITWDEAKEDLGIKD